MHALETLRNAHVSREIRELRGHIFDWFSRVVRAFVPAPDLLSSATSSHPDYTVNAMAGFVDPAKSLLVTITPGRGGVSIAIFALEHNEKFRTWRATLLANSTVLTEIPYCDYRPLPITYRIDVYDIYSVCNDERRKFALGYHVLDKRLLILELTTVREEA